MHNLTSKSAYKVIGKRSNYQKLKIENKELKEEKAGHYQDLKRQKTVMK